MRTELRTLGLVGTGVIGAGWAARALARGLDVVAWDPAPGAEARLREAVDNAWPALVRLGLHPGADRARLRFVAALEAVCEAADLVQESAPEREDLKRGLHARIDAATPREVLVASSSSGLLPTRIQVECVHPDRLVIGHPFNPVYLLPLVEVVGGEATAPEAVEAAIEVYRALGMHPLRVRTEIEGYLSDRLQEALWRENLHLVNDGVATTAELDEAIVYGPGLRWALMGVNQTFHLAGGETGMRHMLAQFGPALELPWTRLEAPELTGALIEHLVEGTAAQAGGRTVRELERLRDDCLVSIMQALAGYRVGAGAVLAADRERRMSAERPLRWSPGADVPAPLELWREAVRPDWIDYNGHMTASAYPAAFDDALEALIQYAGGGPEYRAGGFAFYTVETHTSYHREAKAGEPLAFRAQVLGCTDKAFHLHQTMVHGETGEALAATEQVLLHVDTKAGRAAAMRPPVADAFAAIAAAHAGMARPEDVGRVVGLRRPA